jgi:hypothetical protein
VSTPPSNHTWADARSGRTGADEDAPPRRVLPLECSVVSLNPGWTVRVPVRREEVSVEKRAVVVEEVVLRRRSVEEVVSREETLRREEIRVDAEGDLEVTQPLDAAGIDGHAATSSARRAPPLRRGPGT